MHGFQAHPREGGQQEVVQRCSGGNAQTVVGEGREPRVEKENHAQSQQSGRQIDEYLRWVVPAQLSEVHKKQTQLLRKINEKHAAVAYEQSQNYNI